MDKAQLLHALANKALDAGYNAESGSFLGDHYMQGYLHSLVDTGIVDTTTGYAIALACYRRGRERRQDFLASFIARGARRKK